MHTPPEGPSADEVLQAVRSTWAPDAAQATYLPVGFGAHHWRIDGSSGPVLFATLDVPSGFRTAPLIRAAYRGVLELAEGGFGGAVLPRLTRSGEVAVSTGSGLLSVTPWLEGRSPDETEACASPHAHRVAALLAELHRSPVPPSAPKWFPRVAPGFAERLSTRLAAPWTAGPLSSDAHRTISGARADLHDWEKRYAELIAHARSRRDRWVPTHGEPHHANQFLDDHELRLVDWETLAIAPPERDLRDLPESVRTDFTVDTDLLELFDLEWRLVEIEEYARWFMAPHPGSEDDVIALEGLREEIEAATVTFRTR
ncbi:phosphotransferase [Microbacterium sp. MYb62]|uniref:phosphotransferase n=1 Tax=Microbacterium sp. MYb62 TaxID=1848690 RepID=UPI000CFCBA46|nr:phosphotransferase [Microbacterium sp. MYb62]PRB14445.1 aminoglycoside phosphotransferase [Microbacterium sp. MYb62]